MYIPEGTLFEDSGDPAGEPVGEATGNFQVLKVSTLVRVWYLFITLMSIYINNPPAHCLCAVVPRNFTHEWMLTIAAADGRSLNIASLGQSQSLGLVDVDPKRGTTTIQDLAQALWLWADNGCKLCAASLWWGRRVPCNVIQARWQADQHIRTVRLCRCSCPVNGNDNGKQSHHHLSLCHSSMESTITTASVNNLLRTQKVESLICEVPEQNCLVFVGNGRKKWTKGKKFDLVNHFSYFLNSFLWWSFWGKVVQTWGFDT